MTQPKQPPELTVKQVAELLDLSIRNVQALRARGHFPNAHQLHGGPTMPFLIPQSDLDAEIEQRKKRRQPRQG